MISKDGEQLGVKAMSDALTMAKGEGLDLVEVAPMSNPPVCRIMDYSKYRYEQEKKEKESKKHSRTVHLKEMRLRPKIEEHDYQFKLNHVDKFLKRGDMVKVSMLFRGREMAHVDLGRRVMDRFIGDLAAVGEIEKEPRLEGRSMIMIVIPKKG